MTEAQLTRKFLAAVQAQRPHAVIFKFNDRTTSGIPRLSFPSIPYRPRPSCGILFSSVPASFNVCNMTRLASGANRLTVAVLVIVAKRLILEAH